MCIRTLDLAANGAGPGKFNKTSAGVPGKGRAGSWGVQVSRGFREVPAELLSILLVASRILCRRF